MKGQSEPEILARIGKDGVGVRRGDKVVDQRGRRGTVSELKDFADEWGLYLLDARGETFWRMPRELELA